MGHIPEDRQRRGLVLDFTLAENLGAARYPPAARLALRHAPTARAIAERARRLLSEFDVRGGGPGTPARALSGGNQQKVVHRPRDVGRRAGS